MAPEQQTGALLSELINQSQHENGIETEIITISLPGFGPGPFIYEAFVEEIIGQMKPDEVIIREGDMCDGFYFVMEGTVRVTLDERNGPPATNWFIQLMMMAN